MGKKEVKKEDLGKVGVTTVLNTMDRLENELVDAQYKAAWNTLYGALNERLPKSKGGEVEEDKPREDEPEEVEYDDESMPD